jgi:hypothetical protein
VSRTSLTDQIVDLRRTYTGENLTQAVAAVRPLLQRLSADQRGLLTDTLRGGSAVPDGLRRALLPDVTFAAQQELEAGLLRAACDTASYLHLRPPAVPAHAFSTVEPHDWPRLHVAERALGPLLYELLPRVEVGQLMGLPGLRHRRHPRAVELYLADAPDARAVLSGVDAAAWDEAMRYVRGLHDFRGLDTRLIGDEPLGGLERESSRVVGPVALGSALLRRVHLFAGAPWLRSWAQGDQWWLEWPGEPRQVAVADRLIHPVFGLPGHFETSIGAETISLVGQVTLSLRGVLAPAAEFSERLKDFDWPAEFNSGS